MAPEGRNDLLAYLTRYSRRPGLMVRRAERWRRRGWSWERIAAEAEAVAASLASRGVAVGDRVALHLNDGPLWHAAFFGALRAGAVAVPLDAALEPHIVREQAAALELAAWCAEREVPDLGLPGPGIELHWGRGAAGPDLRPPDWPPDDPSRVAEIVLTSGTGGAPKAVPVTHANLRSVLDGLAAGIEEYRWALRLAPPLHLAVALPLSHLYGQVMGVFLPSLLESHVTLLPAMPAPDLARAIREERAWVLATVPRTLGLLGRHLRAEGDAIWDPDGMARRLAAAPSASWWGRPLAFARLRRRLGVRLVAVVSGGAALDAEVEEFWRALGYVVVQGYGLTETAPLVTLNHPFDTRAGSLGRPLPGVEVRIAEDGEILVRGPNVVTARLGGRATDHEGWLHTGDLGRRDETGRLIYGGRKADRIVTPAGVNVDSEPVADRLRREPGVHDAVVVERPWGERGVVCAVLVLEPGADADAAVRSANEDLPDAARIRSSHVWPEADFPRTRTGKVRRPPVLEWLKGRAPGPAALGESASSSPAGDGFTVLAGLVAGIAGVALDDFDPATRIGDVLGSLDRVELVTRLESTYGFSMGAESFAGEQTLGDLAEELRAATPTWAREACSVRGVAEPAVPEEHTAVRRAEAGTRAPRGLGRRLTGALEARWRFWAPVCASRWMFRTTVLRPLWRSLFAMDVDGREHVESLDPPFIIAANHLSELDPGAILFALSAAPSARIATTAMWEYFPRARTGPGLYALAVWGLNLVPLVQLGDWRPTLRIAGAVADRGGCPLVYPEGERSLDGALLPFRKGVAVMAQELHLPILPCGAAGLLAVLPKGSRGMRNCWLGRAPVALRFGTPLAAPRPDDDLDVLVTELADRIDGLVREARKAAGRY